MTFIGCRVDTGLLELVIILVSGLALRVVYGSVITHVAISEWLYLVLICGAFYLGFGKRRNELAR